MIEKTAYIGGSTARSGGAFWIPADPDLLAAGASGSLDLATAYVRSVVGDSAPATRWRSALRHGPATVEMLRRTTPMHFSWARDYLHYHPETSGGSAADAVANAVLSTCRCSAPNAPGCDQPCCPHPSRRRSPAPAIGE